jgi:hypothetical protein
MLLQFSHFLFTKIIASPGEERGKTPLNFHSYLMHVSGDTVPLNNIYRYIYFIHNVSVLGIRIHKDPELMAGYTSESGQKIFQIKQNLIDTKVIGYRL